jgi:hypothetical protein
VAVEHEKDSTAVKKEGESLTVVFDHGAVGLLWVVTHGRMVAIAVESLKIGLVGNGTAGGRNSAEENPSELSNHSGVHSCRPEGLKDCMVVSVGTNMGSSNPSYKVSNTTIEMEESCSSHCNSVIVDNSL